ncbi:MAG: hypothetical protein L3J31_01720 [Bacteroidales bacterium]|nr:hypothetical protein [Bacteroidales bacterium]MCF6341509.1 hypothetical protein [Bacteroidales bacterium]
MEMKNTEKFRNACQMASQVFAKPGMEKYLDLKSKLDYCIGSYDYDKNPSGLYEYGVIALKELEAFKKKNPRKVNKKILSDLKKFSQS